MTLPIIKSKGIQAYCTDLVMDPEGTAYLLSVAGYQVAVKGIIANVLDCGPVSVYGAGLRVEITRDSTAYQVHYHRLPSGLYQAALVPKMAFAKCQEPKDRFLVLCQDNGKELFFDLLQAKSDIPLHPSWADWLWHHLARQNQLVALETVVGDYRGYLAFIDRNQLMQDLAEQLSNKTPELMHCFERNPNHE